MFVFFDCLFDFDSSLFKWAYGVLSFFVEQLPHRLCSFDGFTFREALHRTILGFQLSYPAHALLVTTEIFNSSDELQIVCCVATRFLAVRAFAAKSLLIFRVE